ncbi:MAG: hypothetical protein H6581_00520 [Bacteroidia bacterium]|nr:hypothetical protein [Bacteroidia bacterium]
MNKLYLQLIKPELNFLIKGKMACLYLFLLIPFAWGKAQSTTPPEIENLFWGAGDWKTEKSQVPEEWSREEAVIIYQENFNAYENRGLTGIFSVESYRMRIKMNSWKVLEENASFTYVDNRDEKGRFSSMDRFYAGFKLIHEDGKEEIIDLKKAYPIFENATLKVMKIEIHGMKQGDILDYYYYTADRVDAENYFVFRPDIQILTSPYPIMRQKITYKVDNKFYLNYRCINNAPELKVEPGEDFTLYTYVEEDRDKFEPQLWHLPLMSSPTIKFQVIYAKSLFKSQLDQFMGEPGKPKNSVTPEEIAQIPRNRLRRNNSSSVAGLKLLRKMLKDKNLGPETPDMAIAEYAFYELRKFLYVDKGFNSFTNMYVEEGDENKVFVKTMNEFLLEQGIGHVIVVAIPRQKSTLENLIIADEVSFLIGLPGAEFTFLNMESPHNQFGQLPAHLEGSDAWLLPPNIEETAAGFSKMPLPVSSHDQNVEKIVTHAHFPEFGSPVLRVGRTHQISGGAKLFWQEKLSGESFSAQVATVTDLVEQEMEAEVNDFRMFRLHALGEGIGEEKVIFQEEFDVNGVGVKVGDGIILKAGMLIGRQVNPADHEVLREADIYHPFAGSKEWEITVDIPVGYQLIGVEKLNKMVMNETGGFRSTATFADHKLEIRATLFNINLMEPVWMWRKILEILQAAYDFTQEVLVVKK